MSSEVPRIKAVRALEPYRVEIEWNNGITCRIDLEKHIGTFKVFQELRERPELWPGVEVDEWGYSIGWNPRTEIPCNVLWRLFLEQTAGGMLPDDFRAWRKRHGLTQVAAGEALGIHRRTVQTYEGGKTVIPKTVRLAIYGWEQMHTSEGEHSRAS